MILFGTGCLEPNRSHKSWLNPVKSTSVTKYGRWCCSDFLEGEKIQTAKNTPLQLDQTLQEQGAGKMATVSMAPLFLIWKKTAWCYVPTDSQWRVGIRRDDRSCHLWGVFTDIYSIFPEVLKSLFLTNSTEPWRK